MEFEDRSTRPDDMYHRRCLTDAVQQSVKELGPHHREVFVLREIEGKSYAEIAEIAGCSLGTVKSRLNRARLHFARVIKPRLD
jgi:RNA polymerase sigma-70 factor (ECF subfamily)